MTEFCHPDLAHFGPNFWPKIVPFWGPFLEPFWGALRGALSSENTRKSKGFGAFRVPFVVLFWGPFWGAFWGPFWDHFGSILEAFWYILGPFLGNAISAFQTFQTIKLSIQLSRPRRIGKFPVRIDPNSSFSKLSKQLLSKQQFQVPPELWKVKVY